LIVSVVPVIKFQVSLLATVFQLPAQSSYLTYPHYQRQNITEENNSKSTTSKNSICLNDIVKTSISKISE